MYGVDDEDFDGALRITIILYKLHTLLNTNRGIIPLVFSHKRLVTPF